MYPGGRRKMKLSPEKFGLPKRTVLEQTDTETIALVIHRKSRIIMADGRKIVDKLNLIRNEHPQWKTVLKTTAPVCSKTKIYLNENNIEIIFVGN